MPRKNITAYDLLISCPGDVSKYVDVIKECIESFNITIGRLIMQKLLVDIGQRVVILNQVIDLRRY